MKNIVCDNCNRTFNFTQDMLKEEYIGAMIASTYYNCPKCGKKYIVCVMNSKVRRLKKRMKERLDFIKKNNGDEEVCGKAIVEYHDIANALSKEMDRINKGQALT
ncbi:MAG TPA: hypothetical protein DCM59_09595 [Clostridium sp.]|nr:hypothetical protein [Clostridium sp.]